jgi:hypothetical protein
MRKSQTAELLGQCGENWIAQDVRECAAQKEIDEASALGAVMKEKAEEFVAAGGEIYQGAPSRSGTAPL